jgi:hypothetical protein
MRSNVRRALPFSGGSSAQAIDATSFALANWESCSATFPPGPLDKITLPNHRSC